MFRVRVTMFRVRLFWGEGVLVIGCLGLRVFRVRVFQG